MNRILIGKGEQPVELLGQYGNRHGLIAGATGTGKTVSLMVLAEGFSRMGVPLWRPMPRCRVKRKDFPGSAWRTMSALSVRLIRFWRRPKRPERA